MAGPSVLSTLAGNKTQMRRPIKDVLDWVDRFEIDGKNARGYSIETGISKFQSIKIPHPVGAVRYAKESKSMKAIDSRLHIEITGVRVERVQDISDDDVMAEGCIKRYPWGHEDFVNDIYEYSMDGLEWFSTPKQAYKGYFIKINGKKAWDANPWVFVYDYKEVWRKEG